MRRTNDLGVSTFRTGVIESLHKFISLLYKKQCESHIYSDANGIVCGCNKRA